MPDPIEPTLIGSPLRDAAVDPLPGDLILHEPDPHLTRPPDGGAGPFGGGVPLSIQGIKPIRPVRRRTR